MTEYAQRMFWDRISAAMDAPKDLTSYCLRHDYCTRLKEAKVPIEIACKLMGHSSIELTNKIYTHQTDVITEQVRTLINSLNENQ